MKNKKTGQEMVELYQAPMIEVNKIVIEQNILQSGSGPLPDIPGDFWG